MPKIMLKVSYKSQGKSSLYLYLKLLILKNSFHSMKINTMVTNFLGNKSVIPMLTRAQLTQTPPVVAAGDGPHVFLLMSS